MSASRPVPACSSTAAATSSSPPATPAATTCSRTWSSGRASSRHRPDAKDRVLYSLHFGKVPGVSGGPTNFGLDPYVATRGTNGWTTRYVGIPADETPGAKPFGSPLSGSDEDLNAFAFGGTGLCSPCFPDGSTGIPVRMPDGGLVQGMKGSLDPGPASNPGRLHRPAALRRRDPPRLRLDLEIRGTAPPTATSRSTTATSASGTTHVVSRTPGRRDDDRDRESASSTISADGSRVLVGKLVAPDDRIGDQLLASST